MSSLPEKRVLEEIERDLRRDRWFVLRLALASMPLWLRHLIALCLGAACCLAILLATALVPHSPPPTPPIHAPAHPSPTAGTWPTSAPSALMPR
jgi:hypothetical protein